MGTEVAARIYANLIKVRVVHTECRGQRDLQSDQFCNNSHIAQFRGRQHAVYIMQLICFIMLIFRSEILFSQ